MRVISIDNLEVSAGDLCVFEPQSAASGPSAAPPSFNQRHHVATSGTGGGWLGVTFDLPSSPCLDPRALQSAFGSLISNHETLRSSFATQDGGVERVIHAAPHAWLRRSVTLSGGPDERRAQLRAVIDSHTRPHRFPGYLLGVVRGEGSATATVIAAFNHVHVDAVSLTVVVEDLLAAYRGAPPAPAPSHLAYCARADEPSPASATGIARWHDFFDTHRGLPRFPADLGLDAGERAPQRVVVTPMLDPDRAESAEERCRSAGGRMSAGVLAACASAAATLSAPGTDSRALGTILPVSTRRDPRWARSLGWFVTNVPLEIPVYDGAGEGVAAAQAALDGALELSGVPLGDVLATYSGPLDLDRDLFMLSYLDYRRVSSTRVLADHNAHHVSASTPTDDVQVWFSRNHEGLAVRVRMPDTGAAVTAVGVWLDRVQSHLTALSNDTEMATSWK